MLLSSVDFVQQEQNAGHWGEKSGDRLRPFSHEVDGKTHINWLVQSVW